jgi:hypothetical protein
MATAVAPAVAPHFMGELINETAQGQRCSGIEFCKRQIPLLLGVCSLKPLFHDGQIFVLAQGAIVVGVGSREVLTTQSHPTRFPSRQCAGAIAIQCVELGRRRFLDLVKINLAVTISVDRLKEPPLAARAGWLKPTSTVAVTYPIAARLDSIRSTPKSVGTRRTANLIDSRPRRTSSCQHHHPPLPRQQLASDEPGAVAYEPRQQCASHVLRWVPGLVPLRSTRPGHENAGTGQFSCPGQARASELSFRTISARAREPGPRSHTKIRSARTIA